MGVSFSKTERQNKMSLYEIDEPGRTPMIVGGNSFGLENARYLQETIKQDEKHPEEVVMGFDAEKLERTLPIAELLITRS